MCKNMVTSEPAVGPNEPTVSAVVSTPPASEPAADTTVQPQQPEGGKIGTGRPAVGSEVAPVGTFEPAVGSIAAGGGTVVAGVGAVEPAVGSLDAGVGTAVAGVGTFGPAAGSLDARVDTVATRVATMAPGVGTEPLSVCLYSEVGKIMSGVGTARSVTASLYNVSCQLYGLERATILHMQPNDVSRIYSLCRIDARKHLFYEDSEMAKRAAQPAVPRKSKRGELAAMGGCKRLPRPAINFRASPSIHNKTTAYLFSILGGESNILYSDNNCQTTLCNLDLNIIDPFAPPTSRKSWNAISLPITSPIKPLSLYVLDLFPNARPGCCFEVLSHRDNERSHPHPHPAVAIGTYTFDTVSRKWSQAAHWALPFFGRAEYVPELGLWFGLSSCNPFSSLCALDLSAMDPGQPPKLQHTWDYIDLPEEEPWSPSQLHLFSLGSGKFCVAAFFGTELGTCGMSAYNSNYEATFRRECAVFTGLEVKR
uniref:Uncharacterized protein n=1 Tax=Aegilops tauschii TaxID=37682 RepID=M8AWY4_AEGTA